MCRETKGEIAIRGNTVMTGYYKDRAATEADFQDGWFWSGDAAVVARPHARWGEPPCAFVELRAGAAATEAELIAFCGARIAHFEAPKTVVFGPIPKTATGKIQKFLLRQAAREMGEQC